LGVQAAVFAPSERIVESPLHTFGVGAVAGPPQIVGEGQAAAAVETPPSVPCARVTAPPSGA
jgi:hypothetical protein